jgi:hypothetical protein
MSTLNLNLELAEQAIRRLESTHGTVCDEIKNVQRQAYGVLQDGRLPTPPENLGACRRL